MRASPNSSNLFVHHFLVHIQIRERLEGLRAHVTVERPLVSMCAVRVLNGAHGFYLATITYKAGL
jgi:hypothetical protein